MKILNDDGLRVVDENGVITRVSLESVIQDDIYLIGNQKIISYDGVKKLATATQIVLKETPTLLCTPDLQNHQQHIWGIWVGRKDQPEISDWSFSEGEASRLNTGSYAGRDSNNKPIHDEWVSIDSKYKSAMAYKRAYCRAVLNCIGLVGVYSSVESPDFESSVPVASVKINDYANL